MLLAIIVGAILRCYGINGIELQYDEAATGYFAGLPWMDLWGSPAVLEPNPPLFYSMARLVMLGGGDVEQIRIVSAAAGILSIPAAWMIGRLLAGRFAAGAAAWLVATSPQNIAFSQYARAYAVLSLFLLCAFICFVLARRATNTRTSLLWWLCYAIVSTASLYLHYTAIVILAAFNLSVLANALGGSVPARRFWVGWLAANAAVACAYAPWLPLLVHQATLAAGVVSVAAVHRTNLIQRLLKTAQRPFIFEGLSWVDPWLLPLAAVGVWQFRASRDAMVLVLTVAAGLILLLLVSQWHPMLDAKTLAWAGLFTLLVATLGLQATGQLRWAILAPLLLMQAWTDISQARESRADREGWRDVASLLRLKAEAHDIVFINDAGAILALRHYNWPEARLDIRILARPTAEPWFRGVPGTWVAGPEAVSAAAGSGRVWVLTYHSPSTQNALVELAGGAPRRRLFFHAGLIDLSLLGPFGN